MMNINTYLNEINNTKGFEAYLEADENLWELYNESYEDFENFCENHNINLKATREIIIGGIIELELNLWVYDHEE